MTKFIVSASPNCDSRDGHVIDMLVLHYTGMPTGEAALSRLMDPAAKVSAHYMVEEDGSIIQLVNEDMRAWHAGVSSWQGQSNLNQRSIGIEIVNPGHEFGYRPFPFTQMQAVAWLCTDIVSRHAIPARRVLGHSDIAPTRKEDPGELFNWPMLAEHGVGLWPKALRNEQATWESLANYGYDLSNPAKAILAFQRHFRPGQLHPQWDEECAAILAELLRLAESQKSG